MNSVALLILPLTGALLGWLAVRILLHLLFRPRHPRIFLGLRIQGVIPKRQTQLAGELGRKAASLIEGSDLAARTGDPAIIAALMPGIERHIDGFLQQRLKEKIPVLAMFLSDGVLATIKTSLLDEIEALLPQVIGQFAANLGSSLDIGRLVREKISAIPPERLEQMLRDSMKQEFRMLGLAGALLGLIIGLIQLALSAGLQAM